MQEKNKILKAQEVKYAFIPVVTSVAWACACL